MTRRLRLCRRSAARKIGEEITAKATTIKGAMSYDKANKSKLTGKVIAKGKKLNLIHFQAKLTAQGVTAKIYKDGERALFPHAFFQKTKKGKQLVMEREYTGARKAWDKRKKYAKMSRAYRLPIRPIIADVGIPHMLERSDIMRLTLTVGGDAMLKNVNREMNYELERL